jgi:hypothetical protein
MSGELYSPRAWTFPYQDPTVVANEEMKIDEFNPTKDIPDLNGKVFFVTGGMIAFDHCYEGLSSPDHRHCWLRKGDGT